MKKLLFIFGISLLSNIGFSQSHFSTQAHQLPVTDLQPSGNTDSTEKAFYTASQDGFLIKWTDDDQGEHYQITEYDIKMISVSPNGRDIAVYESDGGLFNRISVWNWKTLSRKFSRRFSDSITSLNYSATGNYLIAGTATMSGATFLNGNTGDILRNKIKDSTGIISYATTTQSEKTAAMYSPTGSLSYYNLPTGRLTKKIFVEPALKNPVLFNNFMFLAGTKDDNIYVINALTGITIAQVPASSPVSVTSQADHDYFYLENDLRGNYTLKSLQNINNKHVSSPVIIKNLKGPRSNETITHGAKIGSDILLGSRSGDVYRLTTMPETQTETMSPITDNFYDQILDMSPIDENFYFLTKNSLFISSYDTGSVNGVGKNPGQTNVIPYENKVILWSKGSRKTVQLFDFSKPELTDLFTPKSNLQSIKLFGNIILEMENNSVVNTYNIDSKTFSEVYTGAGLQDAVISEDGKLYVAKSFATNPQSSLLCVDMETKETVPISIKGNVSFALNVNKNNIYGISVQEMDNSKKTVIFRYNTQTKQASTLLNLSEEDTDAFAYLKYPVLYTNIGHDKVRAVNLLQNRSISLNRSASMPAKVSRNAKQVIVLNKDGSISWYNDNLSQVLADWYLTRDGQWYEF